MKIVILPIAIGLHFSKIGL